MKGKAISMKNRGILIACLMLTSAFLLRAEDTAQDVLDRVHKRYDQISDAEVRFVQKAKFPLAKLEQEVTGTLQFKKTNKYRVEFEGQLVVTNGETVWSYSAQNNQVLIDKFKFDERSLSPERILTAAPDDFSATLVGREKTTHGDEIALKLTPRDPANLLKSMKLWVNESDWLIHKVEMLDQHGKVTTYQVSSFKTNIGIPDSRFVYQVPAGVEVVDLRD
jgi:outer membrane lipoprotein carrier protein